MAAVAKLERTRGEGESELLEMIRTRSMRLGHFKLASGRVTAWPMKMIGMVSTIMIGPSSVCASRGVSQKAPIVVNSVAYIK